METRSSTDGVVRLNSYQRVASYPLVVAAALATDELLAPWWSATGVQVLRGAAFLATITAQHAANHSQAAHEGERVCEHRQASGRMLEVRIVPFTGGGQIRTFHDITDRKQIEDRLQASESKFRLLAENASDVIVLLRNHDDTRLYVSPSIERLLGYPPGEFIAMDRRDFIHPDDQAPMLAIRAGLGAGRRTVTSLHRLRHRHGHFVWVETACWSSTSSSTKTSRAPCWRRRAIASTWSTTASMPSRRSRSNAMIWS
jgi:PAS domain S-box-containing protein